MTENQVDTNQIEEELIRKAQNDLRAFDAVYLFYVKQVYRYFAAMFSGGAARQIRSIDPLTGAYEDLFVMEDASVKGLNAVLSPDGQWIAYPGRDYQSVHMVSLDGSANRLLLDNLSMTPIALVWNKQGWLGVSLRQTNSEIQTIILVNPDSCEIYEVPGVTGTLEGLFIK